MMFLYDNVPFQFIPSVKQPFEPATKYRVKLNCWRQERICIDIEYPGITLHLAQLHSIRGVDSPTVNTTDI
jgi:hypothetical protein